MCLVLLKNFRDWLLSVNPQGLGTLLLGIAALIALIQTSSVLDRILLIQKQAKEIKVAVGELKSKSIEMTSALSMMANQLKELKAREVTAPLPINDLTIEKIKAVFKTIPKKPSLNNSMIYLPAEKVEQTAVSVFKAKTQGERTQILKNALEYQSGNLLQENGQPIILDQTEMPK